MLDNLPTEICSDILHRLGVKTLIKCTILSKSYLSLITSHDFLSTHIVQVVQHTNPLLLLRYFTVDSEKKKKKYHEMYHFEPDDDTFSGFQSQGLLVPFLNYPDKFFTVAGCVNGVLCLVSDFRIKSYYTNPLIILWNPSIRKFVHVPQPNIVYETYGAYESVCGFGFDSVSDDYKVVRVVFKLDDAASDDAASDDAASDDAAYEMRENYPPTQVEVFSLKSGCWRVIGEGPSYLIKRQHCGYTPPCFCNGSVYWVGYSLVDPNENVILKFDMSTEIFEIIQLPLILIKNESAGIMDLYVQEYKGNLSLIKPNYDDVIRTCTAWLMKEDGVVKSWTKMFDFDIDKSHPFGTPRAFGFRKNGEILMVKGGHNTYSGCRSENAVVSTDLVSHGVTALRGIRGIGLDRVSFYLSTYVESMVLFKEGKGIKKHTAQLDLW